MRDAVDLGARGVHGVVDHVGGFVEEADGAALDDFAGGIDKDEVGGFEVRPGDAKGVDPEGGGLDGVLVLSVDGGGGSGVGDRGVTHAEGDMARDAFVEAQFGEDAVGEDETAFEVFSCLVWVVEGRWRGKGLLGSVAVLLVKGYC